MRPRFLYILVLPSIFGIQMEDLPGILEDSSGYKINITLHAKLKIDHEQLSEDEICENLKNPGKLHHYVVEGGNKYILYFKLSNSIGHKYVIEINHYEKEIKVITVVKLRIRWQKKAEKYVK